MFFSVITENSNLGGGGGGGSKKQKQYIGGIASKGRMLGQFADLRGEGEGLSKKDRVRYTTL